MSAQVIEARGRFGQPAAVNHQVDAAVEQLRRSTRVPVEDRPRLAIGLGRIASLINSARPKHAARQMFERAGGAYREKWPKRHRLVRLPDEPAKLPALPGAYEGGGAAYVALAEAAVAILGSDDRGRIKLLREFVSGTTYLPEPPPLAAATEDAIGLVNRLAERVGQRIATETRLLELWRALAQNPFSLKPVPADSHADGLNPEATLRHDDAIAAIRSEALGDASLLATRLNKIRNQCGPVQFFHERSQWASDELSPMESFMAAVTATIGGKDWMLGWAEPSLFVGWLVRRIEADTFQVPREIAAYLQDEADGSYSFYDDPLRPEVEEWMDSIGWIKRPIDGRERRPLPLTKYDHRCGWGWRRLPYYRISPIFLKCSFDISAPPKLRLHRSDGHEDAERYWIPAFVPKPSSFPDERNDRLLRAIIADGQIYRQPYQLNPVPVAAMGFAELIYWPDWMTDDLAPGARPGGAIGFIDQYTSDDPLPSFEEGWIEDPSIVNAMFGANGWWFEPARPAPNGVVPCSEGSLAADLLRRECWGDAGDRLSDELVSQAELIATTGLAYHEAIVEHCRLKLT